MIFGLDMHGWEHIMIASLCVTAAAAVLLALSSWIVVRFQREEAMASAERISVATAAAENAKANAANANLKAEEARLETERVKAAVAWRELSKEQAQKLVAPLAKFKGSAAPITVVWINSNQEAANFAEVIERTLRDAGLKTELAGTDITTANIVGISFRTDNSPLAEAILLGFRDAGLAVKIAEPLHNSIVIRVGAKPRM